MRKIRKIPKKVTTQKKKRGISKYVYVTKYSDINKSISQNKDEKNGTRFVIDTQRWTKNINSNSDDEYEENLSVYYKVGQTSKNSSLN